MKSFRLFLAIVLFASSSISLNAQEIFTWGKEKEFCSPSVIGLPRAKAVVLKFEMQPDYTIKSTGKSGNFGNSEAKVDLNHRIDVRIRFPIINKPSITIAGGIKYTKEEFKFENGRSLTYPLYQELEDRALKSAGLHFYLLKPTRGKNYFIVRTSFDLNGDYGSDNFAKREFLKFSITPLIGWKQNENLSYAAGFTYGYTFGVPLIIPVFSINKNFNCNFGLESVLPLSIKLRYQKNEKTYWYGGLELNGASYRLDSKNAAFANYNKLHLFRSELREVITFEKEIHDWLWFGIEGGFRQNFRFSLTNSPKVKADVLISNKLGGAPLINASLFVVPPQTFLNKKK